MDKKLIEFLVLVLIVTIVAGAISFVRNYEIPQVSNERVCNADADCACGVHKTSGDCFYGNRNYVNTARQCPDFCRGISGHLEIKCVNNKCVQA